MPPVHSSSIGKSCSSPLLELISTTSTDYSTEGNVFCSRKQWESLTVVELTTDRLRVRHATHCTTPFFLF